MDHRAAAPLGPDFPPADEEEWRRRVEGDFDGRARAVTGLDTRPLYSRRDLPRPEASGLPGRPPFVRGRRATLARFRITQEYRHGTAEEILRQLAADLAAGVERLWLRVGPPHAGRANLATADDFAAILAALEPGRPDVVLEPGAHAPSIVPNYLAAIEQRGFSPATLTGGLGCDPLGTLLVDGTLPGSSLPAGVDEALGHAAELAAWSHREAPYLRSLLVSAIPYHRAGASAIEELAFSLAAGVELLRRASGGIGVDAMSEEILFAWSVGDDVFLEIAKLRAARLLWSKVTTAAGGRAAAMAMHVTASRFTRAARDPWSNLLRDSAEGFAAAVAGADSISLVPFDEAVGEPGAASRRLALTALHVLRDEAHLGRVLDPAGGSYLLETLTMQLARAAWELFREVERRGGAVRAILDGFIQAQIARSAAARRERARSGETVIVGVNRFVDPESELPETAGSETANSPEVPPPSIGQDSPGIEPLRPWRLAELFEESGK